MRIFYYTSFIAYLLTKHQCSADIHEVAIDQSRISKNLIIQEASQEGKKTKAPKPFDPDSVLHAVYVGYEHNCVLFKQGLNRVRCWGSNGSGQLGYGDNLTRGDELLDMGDNLPDISLGISKQITYFDAGGFHNCATFINGRGKCFGDNRYGQLALGDINNRGDQPNEMGKNLPFIDIGKENKILAIVTGLFHTCIATEKFILACFGNNEHGQLGLGDSINRGGSLNHVGENTAFTELSFDDEFWLSTGSTANHTCVVHDLHAKCWGSNSKGQLAYGDTNNRGDQPNEMGKNLPLIEYPLEPLVFNIGIYVGGANTCIEVRSAIYCVGDNQYGQLALGHTKDVGGNITEVGKNLKPIIFDKEAQAPGAIISTNHICFFEFGKGFKCFGKNSNGELGQGDTLNRGDSPDTIGDAVQYINFGNNFDSYFIRFDRIYARMSAGIGNSHACVAFATNEFFYTIKCFGNGRKGALGYGDTNNRGDQANELGNNLPDVPVRVRKSSKHPTNKPTQKPTKLPTRKPTRNPK